MKIQFPKGTYFWRKTSDVAFPLRIKTTWGFFVSWPFLVNLDLKNWFYCKLDWFEEHTTRFKCSKLEERKWHGHQFTQLREKVNELKSHFQGKLSRNSDRKRKSKLKAWINVTFGTCGLAKANEITQKTTTIKFWKVGGDHKRGRWQRPSAF